MQTAFYAIPSADLGSIQMTTKILTHTRPLAYLRRMEIVRRHTSLRIDANIHNDLVCLGKILDAKAIRQKLLENLEEPYCLF